MLLMLLFVGCCLILPKEQALLCWILISLWEDGDWEKLGSSVPFLFPDS